MGDFLKPISKYILWDEFATQGRKGAVGAGLHGAGAPGALQHTFDLQSMAWLDLNLPSLFDTMYLLDSSTKSTLPQNRQLHILIGNSQQ